MTNECVILYRNPSNGKVGFIGGDDEDHVVAIFGSRDAAIRIADRMPICRAFPWQIVELDEL
jgi:hypothetical protein